jgi:hypothetical protein
MHGREENTYRDFVGKPKAEKKLGIPTYKWRDIIQIVFNL